MVPKPSTVTVTLSRSNSISHTTLEINLKPSGSYSHGTKKFNVSVDGEWCHAPVRKMMSKLPVNGRKDH